MDINTLNQLTAEDCAQQFRTCCTALSWVFEMVDGRPYTNLDELLQKSGRAWANVDFEGWLEACEGHPKIGDVTSLAKKYQGTLEMAGAEQSGMDSAAEDIIERLAEGNRLYENKFGYIFIVFATGKSAAEMLEILESRMDNTPEEELKISMAEQNKITRLRLQKLINFMN